MNYTQAVKLLDGASRVDEPENRWCTVREGTAASHCWHRVGGMLITKISVSALEKCCFCGEERSRSVRINTVPPGHGPHYPS